MTFDPSRAARRLFGWAGAGLAAAALLLAGFSAVETRRIEARYPPDGRFVAVAGGRLHVEERLPVGTPRGTVVLLHGATGHAADLMLPLGDRLAAAGFRVIAPDRPGHGWSDRPDGEADADPARQAVLIRQALERMGVHHAIVLGHSWAGALAVDFALDQADFTDALVLLSPVTHPWSTGVAWYYGAAASPVLGPAFNHVLVTPLGLLLLEAGVRAVFAPQQPPPDFAERTGVAMVLRPDEFAANAQDVEALLPFVRVQAPRMGSIRVPTAIVVGDADGIVSKAIHSDATLRVVPDATMTVLHGVGHSPHWADPQSVVDAVLSVAARMRNAGSASAPAPHT